MSDDDVARLDRELRVFCRLFELGAECVALYPATLSLMVEALSELKRVRAQ